MNALLTATAMLLLPAQEPSSRTWDIDGVMPSAPIDSLTM
jgi:hypothetical protein